VPAPNTPVAAAAPVPEAAVPAETQAAAKPSIAVQQEWRGVESGIKEDRLVVIRNKDAWEGLWTEMQEPGAVPAVNFDDHIVLGIFAGPQPEGSIISMKKIRERKDEIEAPYRIIQADTPVAASTAAAAAAAPVPTHPYLLVLIPQIDKKIRLTEKESQP
jgi:hypothetical protein